MVEAELPSAGAGLSVPLRAFIIQVQCDRPVFQIDSGHRGSYNPGPPQARSERAADVSGLQAASCDLGEHRRKEQGVAIADQNDLDRAFRAKHLFEGFRRGYAAKAAPQNYDLILLLYRLWLRSHRLGPQPQ